MIIQVFLFVQLFTNFWISIGSYYHGCRYCECDTSKGYLVAMNIRNEHPGQNRVILGPLYFFTIVKASYMTETCHSHGRDHEFFGVWWFNFDVPPSFVWPPLFPFFFLTDFSVFFFHNVLAKNPREMMGVKCRFREWGMGWKKLGR